MHKETQNHETSGVKHYRRFDIFNYTLLIDAKLISNLHKGQTCPCNPKMENERIGIYVHTQESNGHSEENHQVNKKNPALCPHCI